MPSIIDMTQRLIDNGHAYVSGGSVWFSVETCPEYGALSGQKPDDMQSSPDQGPTSATPATSPSGRVSSWRALLGQPLGAGRPGWRIECSTMNYEVLGPSIDIHGGGLDLVFPHHENEVAQSVCANRAPYVSYWMHNGLLTMVRRTDEGLVQAAKMGKSLGNVVNIHDALREFPAEALRLYYLQAHYRSPLP